MVRIKPNFCKATMGELESVPDDMLLFIQNWWTDHILESDMEFRSFFEEKGVS